MKKYITQQQRFLYIIFSRYGPIVRVAELLGVARQQVDRMMMTGKMPLKYGSYLGCKQRLHVGLFCYVAYVLTKGKDAFTYETLLSHADFSEEELYYIENGKKMDSPKKIIEATYRKIRRKRA